MGNELTLVEITVRLWLTPDEFWALESRLARERAESEAADARIIAQWEAEDAGR